MADEKVTSEDEVVKYVDVQPAPDAEISQSTGPLVPATSDEVAKAKGTAGAGDDNAANPKNDKEDDKSEDTGKTETKTRSVSVTSEKSTTPSK